MAKLLREPLLHFLVLGVALFLAYGWLSDRGVVADDRVVITQGRIAQLSAGFDAIHQRMPTASELDGMIDEAVREEIYSREAKSMGLDQDDTIIRRRLMTKLQFLSEDTTPVAEPTDAQLQAYLEAHAAEFRVERRYSFTHVYLSPQRHDDHLGADAQALLAQLHQRDGTADVSKFGDPFLLESRFDDVSASELERRFGADFETALRALPAGEWSGPVPSSYGMHVVYIRERNDERTATLTDVRDDVRRKWMQDQRQQANDRYYADLRKRYAVTVERPAIADDGSASTSPATASR
jgi:parvulin-like peptidyl-prolyl isomerase